MKVIAKVLQSCGENRETAQFFTGYGVREIAINLPRTRNRTDSHFVKLREELLSEFGFH